MNNNKQSYTQIFKSSSIIGGSSIVSIITGIIKTKAIAMLLGPSGVGLIGLYSNILATASTLSGLGLNSSGVRQIAHANSTDSKLLIVSVKKSLLLASIILGLIGAICTWLLRGPISMLVFKSPNHSINIGWIAIGIFFTVLSGSQAAILNGMRRITDMAWVTVISSVTSALIAVLSVYFFAASGITVFIISTPILTFFIGQHFLSRIPYPSEIVSFSDIKQQLQLLIKLGSVLMISGLLTTGTQLIVRTKINHDLGIEATGHFQASWTISMLYIGFILTAMGADFYPRLTSVISKPSLVNKMVNEQTEVALLLAGPFLIGTITFSPQIINTLYLQSFEPSIALLRWQILGDLLKIISWPMGIILLASGSGKKYFLVELIWNSCYLMFLFLTIKYFSLASAGIGYFLSYLVFVIVVYLFASKHSGFRFSLLNKKIILIYTIVLGLLFITIHWSIIVGYIFGSMATFFAIIFSIYTLLNFVEIDTVGTGPLGKFIRLINARKN